MAPALRLDMRLDTAGLQRRLNALGAEAPRAVMRAVNRTATSVQTAAVRALAAEMGLKQKDVRKAVAVQKAHLTVYRDRPTAAVIITGKRIPLLAFGARGPEPSRGRGRVTYRIGTGGRKTLPHGFIATMESGHRGVFKRRGDKREARRGRYKGRMRQPIIEVFGPSLPHVAVKAKIVGALRARAAELLAKNLEHETGFLLSQRRSA